MVFSSQVFVFIFLPVVFLLNTAVMAFASEKRPGFVRASNVLLLIASLVFYAWGEPVTVLLLIGEALFCWLATLLIEKKPKLKKFWLAASCVAVLGALAFFKYSGFAAGIISDIFPGNKQLYTAAHDLKQIALPLGISFFSFQILSYVIDVYRGTSSHCGNFFRMLLYVSFFPQLVAGPIVKYREIEEQLGKRRIEAENAAKGARRFVLGLAKKLIIANTAALVADSVFGLETAKISGAAACLGAVFYVLQIYFDFSGYSDMAIGIGAMFGFKFNENFNHPYASLSVKEFWRRWHISLSSWFRDYLYIPLGGNRKGRVRTVLNKFTVFFMTGLWHGANFTFILWGLWHGFFLFLEEILKPAGDRIAAKNETPGKLPKAVIKVVTTVLRLVYTLAVVILGFVMFRSDTVTYGIQYIGRMFSFTGGLTADVLNALTPFTVFAAATGIFAALPWREWAEKLIKSGNRAGNALEKARTGFGRAQTVISFVLALLLFAVCALTLASSSYNPFIYFRF